LSNVLKFTGKPRKKAAVKTATTALSLRERLDKDTSRARTTYEALCVSLTFFLYLQKDPEMVKYLRALVAESMSKGDEFPLVPTTLRGYYHTDISTHVKLLPALTMKRFNELKGEPQ